MLTSLCTCLEELRDTQPKVRSWSWISVFRLSGASTNQSGGIWFILQYNAWWVDRRSLRSHLPHLQGACGTAEMTPAELHGQQRRRITGGTRHPRWLDAGHFLSQRLGLLVDDGALEQAISKGPVIRHGGPVSGVAGVTCSRLSRQPLGLAQFLVPGGDYKVELAGRIQGNGWPLHNKRLSCMSPLINGFLLINTGQCYKYVLFPL